MNYTEIKVVSTRKKEKKFVENEKSGAVFIFFYRHEQTN